MKRTLVIAFSVFFMLSAAGVVPLSYAQDMNKKALRASGAAMASDQVQIWAKSFMEANPAIPVVVTGSSAGKGFQALFDKNTDVALASRMISPEEEKQAAERGLKLSDRLIGYAGVALITSPRNPINELTMAQLRKIFLGEFTNWKQVGGPDAAIRSLTRRVPESGGAVFFQERVLDKQPYGPSTVIAENWSSILKVCASATDLPIGIVPSIITQGAAVKVLGVKEDEYSPAVFPSEDTLKDRSYPIILAFRFYWDSQTQDDRIKRFVDFCASKGRAQQKESKEH